MKDSKSIFRELKAKITIDESPDEKGSIALILLEKVLGITNTDIMAARPLSISPAVTELLTTFIERINDGEPVQYVVGEAFFYGRNFEVNKSVLIPRPETEELIRTVLWWRKTRNKKSSPIRILDVGTGSGCIPVTLALELDDAQIFAIDVSADALAVAMRNANFHAAKVNFSQHDILSGHVPISDLDAIVSNPPYVTFAERHDMRRNVREFEPHLALFVPDEDPLRFYREILKQGANSLNGEGLIAVEINERFGAAV